MDIIRWKACLMFALQLSKFAHKLPLYFILVICHSIKFTSSIQCPPIIEQAAIIVSLYGDVHASAYPAACFSLDPSLAVTVLGIFDIFACMEQRLPAKATIDISAVRSIASVIDYPKQIVCFADTDDSPQSAAFFLSLMSCFRIILLKLGDPLV